MKFVISKWYVEAVQTFGQPDYQTDQPVTTGIKVQLKPAIYKADDPTHENSKFWAASPSGSMELYIQNSACFDFFKVGEFVYLPFIPAVVGLDATREALNGISVERESQG